MANSNGADPDMVLKLPKLLTTYPNLDDINVKGRKLVFGKNGGKLGIIIQQIFGWFDNSSELFVNDICKKLDLTKEQYDQLVEDTFNEVNYTFPEISFIRVYAQKKEFIN